MDQHEAFLCRFLKHQAEIRAFIGSLVRDHHSCDDVFQEVSLILWRSFARYDPGHSFGAWARGIAAKKVMQSWDKVGRQPVPLAPEAIQAVLDAYDRTENTSLPKADALHQCVERLPETQRQLLHLRYADSLKLDEIAGRLSSTVAAVHKALTRVRARLHTCVERRLAVGEA